MTKTVFDACDITVSPVGRTVRLASAATPRRTTLTDEFGLADRFWSDPRVRAAIEEIAAKSTSAGEHPDVELARLRLVDEVERTARDLAREAARSARDEGHTWAAIANVLGKAESTVLQRYSQQSRSAATERQRNYWDRHRTSED